MIDARGPLSDSLTHRVRERTRSIRESGSNPVLAAGQNAPNCKAPPAAAARSIPRRAKGLRGRRAASGGACGPRHAAARRHARARALSLSRIGGAAEGRRARREVKLRAPGVCAAASAVSTTEDPAPPPPPPRHLVSLSRPAASAGPAAHAPRFLSPPRDYSTFDIFYIFYRAILLLTRPT